jgi:hypothetical protein
MDRCDMYGAWKGMESFNIYRDRPANKRDDSAIYWGPLPSAETALPTTGKTFR